ncbi:hypothetical protein RQP46_008350 [Phenoliferia psychrophenolica]
MLQGERVHATDQDSVLVLTPRAAHLQAGQLLPRYSSTAAAKSGKLHRARLPPKNTDMPAPFLQCLPNELLVHIFSCLEPRELIPILLMSRHLSSVASGFVAREASIPNSEDKHGAALVRLHRAGAEKLRVVRFDVPEATIGYDMSAFFLSSFTSITHLTLKYFDDGLEEDWLPTLFTDALKKLSALVSLTLVDFWDIEDSTFSIGAHLPQLRELFVGHLSRANILVKTNGLETLAMDPYLDEPDDAHDLGQTLSSAYKTLKHLILGVYPYDNPSLPLPKTYVRDLVAAAESCKSLESLTLTKFTLFRLGTVHCTAIFEILAAFSQSKVLRRLTLNYEGTFATNENGVRAVKVPSIIHLDLCAKVNQLDAKGDRHQTIRALKEFLRNFPGLQSLSLTGWSQFTSQKALAGSPDDVDDVELGLTTPLALPFLALLRTTNASTVTLRWIGDTKSVRLTRTLGSKGPFDRREVFSPF